MTPQSITSAWLREYRPAGGVLPLSPECAAMLADALDGYDEAARSAIESNCGFFTEPSGDFYDTGDLDPSDDWAKDAIPRAVRYLEARGLIERHPERAQLVRVLEPRA